MAAPIPDYSKVSLLLPMSGSSGGTTFADYSPSAKTVTRSGNAQTSTAQSKFYGSSGVFDGAGDYLTVPTHTDLNLGTGDFRIGAWVYLLSTTQDTYATLLASGQATWQAGCRYLMIGSSRLVRLGGNFGSGSVDILTAPSAIPATTWVYIEVVRIGSDFYLFIGTDGATASLVATGSSSAAWDFSVTATYVGRNAWDGSNGELYGHVNDLCVMKGFTGDTASHPVPTRLIGEIAIETRDESDVLVPRKYFIVPRSYQGVVKASGTTDANGAATVTGLPACEYSVVAQAQGDVLPDKVLRRIAA